MPLSESDPRLPPSQRASAGRVLVIQSVSLIRHGTNTPPVVADSRYSTPCETATTLDYEVDVTQEPQKILDLPLGKLARIAVIHLDGESVIRVGGFKISPGKSMQGEPGDEPLYLTADDRGARCRVVLFPK